MKNEYKHGIKNSAIIMGIQYEIMIDAPDKIMPYGADGGMDCTLKRIMIAKMKKNKRYSTRHGCWRCSRRLGVCRKEMEEQRNAD